MEENRRREKCSSGMEMKAIDEFSHYFFALCELNCQNSRRMPVQ